MKLDHDQHEIGEGVACAYLTAHLVAFQPSYAFSDLSSCT